MERRRTRLTGLLRALSWASSSRAVAVLAVLPPASRRPQAPSCGTRTPSSPARPSATVPWTRRPLRAADAGNRVRRLAVGADRGRRRRPKLGVDRGRWRRPKFTSKLETTPAPVEKVERDEQNMDSGEAEGISRKGCKAVSDENELAEEANRLKSELETARQDRDYQSAQAQSLMADMAKQKEVARRYGVELEDAMKRVAALEEVGLQQGETIRTLQAQLASANEKLTDKELMQFPPGWHVL